MAVHGSCVASCRFPASAGADVTREECLARFLSAVRAGRRGDYNEAKAIVESVRSKAGKTVAERAKKELWAYIKSDKKA